MSVDFTLTTPGVPSGQPVSLAMTQEYGPENPVIGDLDLYQGQIHFWDQQQARIQKVRTILSFGKGEWFINEDEGMPYFGGDMIGSKRKDVARNIIRQAFIVGLPDLAEVKTLILTFEPFSRTAVVEFELLFDDGFILRSSDFGPLEIRL